MLRFVPEPVPREDGRREDEGAVHRPARKEQMETLMNTLEANVDEPIIERGNDARMSYGDRFEVKFVKEDGVWKLKDLD